MRFRIAALTLSAALAACVPASAGSGTPGPMFSVRPIQSATAPSPMLQVEAGNVHAVFPNGWDAKPLLGGEYIQEGFVASPRLRAWERNAGTVEGMEAFWIDVAKVGIPSDYYYLAARGPAISTIRANEACKPARQDVIVDHPPDLTGVSASPGDYVASATGTCRTDGRPTRWAYVVVAPGFGPVRRVGLPNSGLYVVMAVVSGPRSEFLLREMMHRATFGDTPIGAIVEAAGQVR